jgi:hypothetical protein
MNPIRTYILFLCVLCITNLSCTKKSTPAPFDNDPIATRTLRYLTQKAWKETKVEYENQTGTWISMPISNDGLAYSYVFNTNGVYTIFDGTNNIYGSGTWLIIGDNTQLALNKSITYDFSILNNTAMQLSLTGQIPYTDPSSGIVTTYYGMKETFIHY